MNVAGSQGPRDSKCAQPTASYTCPCPSRRPPCHDPARHSAAPSLYWPDRSPSRPTFSPDAWTGSGRSRHFFLGDFQKNGHLSGWYRVISLISYQK